MYYQKSMDYFNCFKGENAYNNDNKNCINDKKSNKPHIFKLRIHLPTYAQIYKFLALYFR